MIFCCHHFPITLHTVVLFLNHPHYELFFHRRRLQEEECVKQDVRLVILDCLSKVPEATDLVCDNIKKNK